MKPVNPKAATPPEYIYSGLPCIEPGCQATREWTKRGKNLFRWQRCRIHRRALSGRSKPFAPITKNGYVSIRLPNGRIVREHRAVMERILGRPLIRRIESVHHKNGIRTDNRPENLELWLGGVRYGQRASDLICPHCSQPYLKPTS